ncbi:molybdopterin-guanine dinucleotide biosynthesis protein B [Sphaerotilus sp.]|uniref:molybdopterin-guanine dinucleotide biosynthesis protein B n=1 Tax=Sphaerotilus sp. TaxID=2093942 RepID=UPI0034E1F324
MNVIGLCGASGSGKTTLGEGLIRAFKAQGCRVSVIKHTHKPFDIDRPGKDSHRHRAAGAFEVLVANPHRIALMREFEVEAHLSVHQLVAELSDLGTLGVEHWVIVEGFKHADLPKVEVWRAAHGAPAMYPDDPFVIAVARPTADSVPHPTGLPLLDLDDPASVADFLRSDPQRYGYRAPEHR